MKRISRRAEAPFYEELDRRMNLPFDYTRVRNALDMDALVPSVTEQVVPTVAGQVVPTVAGQVVPSVAGQVVPSVAGQVVPTAKTVPAAAKPTVPLYRRAAVCTVSVLVATALLGLGVWMIQNRAPGGWFPPFSSSETTGHSSAPSFPTETDATQEETQAASFWGPEETIGFEDPPEETSTATYEEPETTAETESESETETETETETDTEAESRKEFIP